MSEERGCAYFPVECLPDDIYGREVCVRKRMSSEMIEGHTDQSTEQERFHRFQVLHRLERRESFLRIRVPMSKNTESSLQQPPPKRKKTSPKPT